MLHSRDGGQTWRYQVVTSKRCAAAARIFGSSGTVALSSNRGGRPKLAQSRRR